MTSSEAFHEDLLWQAHRALALGRELCSCAGHHHWSYAVLRAAGITSSVGAEEPLLSMTPPLRFELDTSLMEDGPHTMRIEAYDGGANPGLL